MTYKYEIKNQDSFKLKDIFDCGQCFRWNQMNDDTYQGVIFSYVVNVTQHNNNITFKGVTNCKNEDQKSFKTMIKDYFDLDTNYEEYKNKLSQVDQNMKDAISFGSGIRILRQDLFETIISFIISANNNIPRIKKIIERMCEAYGDEINYDGKMYYTFPTIEKLSCASESDLRKLGMGFRDKYIFNTVKKLQQIEINEFKNKSTEEISQLLQTLDGIAEKVSNFILLFSSLHRLDVFPIDVWVRRLMNGLYFHKENEKDLKNKEIMKVADDKFGKLKGLAQQYLFYQIREQ